MTLMGLRKFAVHVKVQLAEGATLRRIDESLLRTRMELALGQLGVVIDSGSTVRDGSAASISLLYLVVETRDQSGKETGFAASSCLQAAQIVRIPRLTTDRHIAYAVVPTWRSCGILVGDTDSYTATILRNADQQIARFLQAWRIVNTPRPTPAVSSPELGIVRDGVKERTSKY